MHEKFNKLDAKFRKERAQRKNKSAQKKQKERLSGLRTTSEENEYEYEYVDEPPQAPPEDTPPINPLHATRPRINIFDYF